MDLDWLFAACERLDPLDERALAGCGVEFLVAATSADTGEPVYLAPGAGDASALLKASSAVPLLYRGPVAVRGHRLVDGGVAAAIPVAEAYRRGARRILVVRSRASGTGGSAGVEHWVGTLALRAYPALARAVWRSPAQYRAALDFIADPPPGCAVLEVAPPRPLATGRTSRALAALARDYGVGLECGDVAVESWEALGAPAASPAWVA
jgi:predicted patatin/cPLA2 family phospholipase